MPELQTNPNEAVCPDFAAEDFATARNALIGDNIDEAAAVNILASAWRANNALDKERWERQRQERAEEQRLRERRQREEQEQQAEARQAEEEAVRKEEQRKHKTKYTLLTRAPPPSTPPEILPPYATARLQKGQYVELWYFTNEGLDYALRSSSTVDENAIVQTVDKDRNATWVSAAASRSSKSVIDDRDLSWEQLLIATPRFLDAIQAAQWTEQRQEMMTDLFTRLQAHPLRASKDPLDRVALLRYLSEQRRLWHQAIDAGTGAWDIGILNEHLLRGATDAVQKERRDREEVERNRADADRARRVSETFATQQQGLTKTLLHHTCQ
ncbi:hypothetical protein C0992_004825 [Termitomyces sp. T32_za158]|nr:hypothetical protein C0992_004825 [Termitomyces sp. T32_za158]